MIVAVLLEVAKNIQSEENRFLLLVVMSCYEESFQVQTCNKK